MRKCLLFYVISFIIFALSIPSANAILLTSNSLDDPTVIDFSQFVNNQQNHFEGPFQVGDLVGVDVTMTGTPFNETDGAFLRNANWGLGKNGFWNEGRDGYAAYAWGDPTGTMLFSFNDAPVSSVGAFINDAPEPEGDDFIISAYDADMNLLVSYDIWASAPISTPGMLNGGAFRGIALESSVISHFGVTGFVPVADDLAFTTTPIPEPATIFLLGAGLAGLVGLGRKKIKK